MDLNKLRQRNYPRSEESYITKYRSINDNIEKSPIKKLSTILGVTIVFIIVVIVLNLQSQPQSENDVVPIVLMVDKNFLEPPSQHMDFPVVGDIDPESVSETLDESSAIEMREDMLSDFAVLIDLENKSVIAERLPHERTYPASLTKIMTVLTAFILADKNDISLDEKVSIPENVFADLSRQNASTANFLPDEQIRLIDLMYGALLPSGADATIGLALYFCPSDNYLASERAYAQIMNEICNEWGLKDTNFTNTSGLHNPNQYSSCYDMAVILSNALSIPQFKEIFTTQDYYKVPPTNLQTDHLLLGTFWKYKFGNENPNFTIIGAKTGYTDEAEHCLATLAVKDGREYIGITMKGRRDVYNPHLQDCYTIYDNYIEKIQEVYNAETTETETTEAY